MVFLECYNFYVFIELILFFKGKKVMVGVIDVVIDIIEILGEVVVILCEVLKYVDVDKFYFCINCGMVFFL